MQDPGSGADTGSNPATVERGIASLGRLADLFRRRRTALAAEVGLTEAEWSVLEEVATEHFLPSLFARDRECSPAAVSKLLRGLAERGIVAAEVGADDARRRPYRLTARGQTLLARLRTSRRRAIDAIWRPLPEADLARFAGFADELAGRLEAWLGVRPENRVARGAASGNGRPEAGRRSEAQAERSRRRAGRAESIGLEGGPRYPRRPRPKPGAGPRRPRRRA